MTGKVVGIHSRIGGSLTANMHVPVDAYKDSSWVRLASSEDWGGDGPASGPYLGVSGDPEADEAKVTDVQPGSPAAKAGIREGDIILKFDGKEVRDVQALAILVRTKKPGDKVKIELRRDGKTQDMEVMIGDRSAS
jgi:serine protease Do